MVEQEIEHNQANLSPGLVVLPGPVPSRDRLLGGGHRLFEQLDLDPDGAGLHAGPRGNDEIAHALLLIFSVSRGRTSNRSRTTPYWATSKMGAVGSVLMATISSAPRMPSRCSGAPLIPTAT